MIERSLHSATSAIYAIFRDLLSIISRIISSFDSGSRGAILCNGGARSRLVVVVMVVVEAPEKLPDGRYWESPRENIPPYSRLLTLLLSERMK